MFFDILRLIFSWLPPPLDTIIFGAFCVLLIFAIIKVIAAIIDMLPFT